MYYNKLELAFGSGFTCTDALVSSRFSTPLFVGCVTVCHCSITTLEPFTISAGQAAEPCARDNFRRELNCIFLNSIISFINRYVIDVDRMNGIAQLINSEVIVS